MSSSMQLIQPLPGTRQLPRWPAPRSGGTVPIIMAVLLSVLFHALLLSVLHTPPSTTLIHAGSLTISLESRAHHVTTARMDAAEPAQAGPATPMTTASTNVTPKALLTADSNPDRLLPPQRNDTNHRASKLTSTTPASRKKSISALRQDDPADRIEPQGTNAASAPDRIRTSLGTQFAHLFHYPRLAQRRGWEGLVKLGVRVHADGQLSNIHLVKTSGHTLLDNNALHTMRRISTLPGARQWLHNRHLDMVLPVEYRLIDG